MTQFARYYILNKLREHSQSKVADRLSSPEDAVEDDLHNIFHTIAANTSAILLFFLDHFKLRGEVHESSHHNIVVSL